MREGAKSRRKGAKEAVERTEQKQKAEERAKKEEKGQLEGK